MNAKQESFAASSLMHILLFISISFQQSHAYLKNSSELTKLLNETMQTYDKRILPTENGEPALVMLQLYIGDMVPVEAIHMHYSIDLYLREFWYDYRLKLPLNKSEQFPLSGQFINDIWTPDIYFPSGKKGKLHDITRPNSLIRILSNGQVRTSQRVSITAFCPMNLQNFPFDEQICDFILEPYSYNRKQCRLQWNKANNGPIYRPKDLRMFEFTLHRIEYDNMTSDYGVFGIYDRLVVSFHFRRNINYYLLQNYFPTSLIVVLSWVGFWIDYRSTPARVALGITTVLTITTLANSIRATLPPVSYSKSIDYYLLACFLFVFAALVEYATVGITDIKWRKRFKRLKKSRPASHQKKAKPETTDNNAKLAEDDFEQLEIPESSGNEVSSPFSCVTNSSAQCDHSIYVNNVNGKDNATFESDHRETALRSRLNSNKNSIEENIENSDCKKRNGTLHDKPRFSLAGIVKAKNLAKRLAENHRKASEIHIIDKISRYLFPLTFAAFNIIYFAVVLTQSTRHHH